jgi:hypothetical protein
MNLEIDNLKKMRNEIENLEKVHQTKIFDIIKAANIDYTQNNNGIFINLRLLKKKTIDSIKSYIDYVRIQKKHLEQAEHDKEMYKEQFYKTSSKDNKEICSLEQ